MRFHSFEEAPEFEKHRAVFRILMDAGELGSRNLCVHWVDVPTGATLKGRSAEGDVEQVCVFVSGTGSMTSAGMTKSVGRGDLVFVPPASEYEVSAGDGEGLAYVCAISPQEAFAEFQDAEDTSDLGDYLDDDV